MPGVKAILLPDEIPSPADTVTDLGAVIKADMRGEKALSAEPVYMGEPVLAVAAVDELTAIEAIERYGLGASGSPILSGTFDVHKRLEARLAAFKRKDKK